MNHKIEDILEKIKIERLRQLNLPGSEWDIKNTPGEWVAIASHYLSEEVRRNGQSPTAILFEDSLIKSAAIIIAIIEHIEIMKSRNELK